MKYDTYYVKKRNTTFAIYEPSITLQENNTSIWYGNKYDYLQVSRMRYNKGKIFKKHKHKFRPRKQYYTNECFILTNGKMKRLIFYLTQDREGKMICWGAGELGRLGAGEAA